MFLSLSSSGLSVNKGDNSDSRISDDFSFQCAKDLTSKRAHFTSSSTSKNIENLERSDSFCENKNEMVVKCLQLKNTLHFEKPLEKCDKIVVKGISIKSIKFAPLYQDDHIKIDFKTHKHLYNYSNKDLEIPSNSRFKPAHDIVKEFPPEKLMDSDKYNPTNDEISNLTIKPEKRSSNESYSEIIKPGTSKSKSTQNDESDQKIDDLSIKSKETRQSSVGSQFSLKNFDKYEARSGMSYCSNIFLDPKNDGCKIRNSLKDYFIKYDLNKAVELYHKERQGDCFKKETSQSNVKEITSDKKESLKDRRISNGSEIVRKKAEYFENKFKTETDSRKNLRETRKEKIQEISKYVSDVDVVSKQCGLIATKK